MHRTLSESLTCALEKEAHGASLMLKDTAVVSKVISESTSHTEPSAQIVLLDAACSVASLEHVFSNQDSC